MTLQAPLAATETVAEQAWIDRPARAVQKGVRALFDAGGPTGRKLRDFLHGVWLGHPLHPVLTDVPIGAWTAAVALDTLDLTTRRPGFGAAADVGVGLGVVSAAAAAVAGLTDWQHVSGGARRVGAIHALGNLVATSLFGASWYMRRRRRRAAGRQLSLLGYLVTMAGAYLGGHLVYAQRIGVKRALADDYPAEFTPVLPADELVEGRLRKAEVRGLPLLLVKRGDRIYALAETCTHLGGPLSEGWLVEDSVVCPWHQSRFHLEDGRVLDGPSTFNQPCFQTRLRNGQVEVRVVRGG